MNFNTTATEKARQYLEKTTPLKGDCGLLCGSVCCKKDASRSNDFGMWLFPHEEKLYKNNTNLKIKKAEGNNSYPFLMCGYSGENGSFCKREERPLFCRFFPYFPVVEEIARNGEKRFKVKIIIHPSAFKLCPAISGKLKITSKFSRALKKAVHILLNDKDNSAEMRKYLIETGEYLKSMSEFASLFFGKQTKEKH